MKKQFILCLCILSVASCANFGDKSNGYSTLADIFVWGNSDTKTKNTQQGVKVSYKERLPLKVSEKQGDNLIIDLLKSKGALHAFEIN